MEVEDCATSKEQTPLKHGCERSFSATTEDSSKGSRINIEYPFIACSKTVRLSYYGESLEFLLGEMYPYIRLLSNPQGQPFGPLREQRRDPGNVGCTSTKQ